MATQEEKIDIEREVDLSMLRVIAISRRVVSAVAANPHHPLSILLAQELEQALKECDGLRLKWLQQVKEGWAKS